MDPPSGGSIRLKPSYSDEFGEGREQLELLVVVGVIAASAVGWGVARYVRSLDSPAGHSEADGHGHGDEPLTVRLLSTPMPVAPFTARDLDGKTISTDSLARQGDIVNFWATWCAPCRAEIPDLVALQDKYRDQLQIIGISQDETGPDVVRQFAAEHRMNYPIVMSTPELEKIFSGIYALPTSFIIDRDMQVVAKHVGLLNPADDRSGNAAAGRTQRRCDRRVRRGRDEGA